MKYAKLRMPDGSIQYMEVEDGATSEQVQSRINANLRTSDFSFQKEQAPSPTELTGESKSPGFIKGEQMGDAARAALTAGQSATLNWGGRAAGLIDPSYPEQIKGAVESYAGQHPWLSAAAGLAGAVATGKPQIAVSRMLPEGMGAASRAATLGLGTGAIAGAGGASPQQGMMQGAASGGLGGGIASPVLQAGVGGAWRIAQGIGSQFSDDMARSLAMRRVAETMIADKVNPNTLARHATTRYPGQPLANVGDAGTFALGDAMAMAPGETKALVSGVRRSMEREAPGRLTDKAYQALGVLPGTRSADTIESWMHQRSTQAKPYWDQVNQTNITVDGDLAALVQRARYDLARARKDATRGGEQFDLPNVKPGDSVPLSQFQTLKETLNDAAETERRAGGDKSARIVGNLKRDLVSSLIAKTTDPTTGISFYGQALEKWAGPSSLISAAQKGREFFSKAASDIAIDKRGMSASELDAFRIGAVDQLREMAGSRASRTRLLDAWRDVNTQEKLREIFPSESEFRKFARDIEIEGKLRRIEKVGTGSQTAERLATADDTSVKVANDAIGMMSGAAQTASGSPANGLRAMLNSGKGLWTQASTPEPVRNEIGQILFDRSMPTGQRAQTINALSDMMEKIKQGKTGAQGSVIYNALFGR